MTERPNSKTSSATERPHILIVSDDPRLVEFLGEGLVYGGFWTSVVASGLQTLEVFRLRTFDLVLIDAALPGLPASDVIRRLRSDVVTSESGRPRTDVPILVVSSGIDEMSTTDAARFGADGTLVAPLELEELVPHLHSVIADWRAAHPGRSYADATSADLGDSTRH
jgi:DNA-binding response OmpR family regulator